MSWKGIVGVGMTVEQFRAYVDTLHWGSWKPSFMVLHNTGAPTASQWHSTAGANRMKNLENYYKNEQHWSAGPHAFVADDLIWPFTPFTTPGVHSPSWNGIALGIELVGDYNVDQITSGFGKAAYENVVALFGILHAKLGLNPETIRFHREDKATTHRDCPGKHIDKARFIQDVIEFMGEAGGHGHAEVAAGPLLKPKPVTYAVNTDGLNVRDRASASGHVLTALRKGTLFNVDGSAKNGTTDWSHGTINGSTTAGWVASRYLDKIVA